MGENNETTGTDVTASQPSPSLPAHHRKEAVIARIKQKQSLVTTAKNTSLVLFALTYAFYVVGKRRFRFLRGSPKRIEATMLQKPSYDTLPLQEAPFSARLWIHAFISCTTQPVVVSFEREKGYFLGIVPYDLPVHRIRDVRYEFRHKDRTFVGDRFAFSERSRYFLSQVEVNAITSVEVGTKVPIWFIPHSPGVDNALTRGGYGVDYSLRVLVWMIMCALVFNFWYMASKESKFEQLLREVQQFSKNDDDEQGGGDDAATDAIIDASSTASELTVAAPDAHATTGEADGDNRNDSSEGGVEHNEMEEEREEERKQLHLDELLRGNREEQDHEGIIPSTTNTSPTATTTTARDTI